MEAGGLDIFQILLQSGVVVKFVLLLLLASSVFSWAIILQKKKVLQAIEKNDVELVKYIAGLKDEGQFIINKNDIIYAMIKSDKISKYSDYFQSIEVDPGYSS